jgi:hypothetical protein
MAIGSKNDPTTRLKNSSQDGNGPKGKMCQWTNEKIEKRVILAQASPLIDTIHNVGTKTHSLR